MILLNALLIQLIHHEDSFLVFAGRECFQQVRKNDLILALGYQMIVVLTACVIKGRSGTPTIFWAKHGENPFTRSLFFRETYSKCFCTAPGDAAILGSWGITNSAMQYFQKIILTNWLHEKYTSLWTFFSRLTWQQQFPSSFFTGQ